MGGEKQRESIWFVVRIVLAFLTPSVCLDRDIIPTPQLDAHM